MHFKLLLLTVILAAGCRQRRSLPVPESNVVVKEAQASKTDTFGVLITTIEFQVKAAQKDRDIYENGIAPWISLEHPDKEIPGLIDADEMVLPYAKAMLVIDYPLSKPAYFELTTMGKGFTRKQLILEISDKYHRIYQEEEKSATVKTVPVDKRENLLNRNETNGKYGIWGHDLSDLDLSAVEVYRNAKGEIYLQLNVES